MAKLTIQEVEEKTSKKNDPYLLVKSSNGKLYSVWEQHLFHLFEPGATLDVSVEVSGKFTTIVAVGGEIEPNGGITRFKTGGIGDEKPSAWDKLWQRLDSFESKLDFLIEEKKTLNGLQEINLHHPLPNLSDLPEYNLEDK